MVLEVAEVAWDGVEAVNVVEVKAVETVIAEVVLVNQCGRRWRW